MDGVNGVGIMKHKQPESLDQIVTRMGFSKCEWPPSNDDVCENCGRENAQMYFAGPTDSGTYWCLDCIVEAFGYIWK